MARDLVSTLAAEAFDLVVHSGLIRTRRLAEAIARATGAELIEDPRWTERDFGDWEGRRWDAIWRETGSAMGGMIADPAGFHPGGGETTAALAARAWSAWEDLPNDGRILVVAHGGPIAVVRMRLAGADYPALAGFIPSPGEIVTL